MPSFPDFKSITLEDQDEIRGYFTAYQPETSELTFTNLFIWRNRYRFQWSVLEDCLIVMGGPDDADPYFLPPVGSGSRKEIVRRLLRWMREAMGMENPRIERADARLIEELGDASDLRIDAIRDDFDYLYRREDLSYLSGRKYHPKRNHIHRIEREFPFEYSPITMKLIHDCLRLTKKWCDWRECRVRPEIRADCEAVHEAMMHFEELGLQGGAVCVNGDVRAFALGEMMNEDTMVVHVEKADPDASQFYAVVNQRFSENAPPGTAFINREQDMGKGGLRKAKLSYYPERLVEKYRIRLAAPDVLSIPKSEKG